MASHHATLLLAAALLCVAPSAAAVEVTYAEELRIFAEWTLYGATAGATVNRTGTDVIASADCQPPSYPLLASCTVDVDGEAAGPVSADLPPVSLGLTFVLPSSLLTTPTPACGRLDAEAAGLATSPRGCGSYSAAWGGCPSLAGEGDDGRPDGVFRDEGGSFDATVCAPAALYHGDLAQATLCFRDRVGQDIACVTGGSFHAGGRRCVQGEVAGWLPGRVPIGPACASGPLI